MQSIDSIEAYVHRTSKGSVSDKEEIKCKDIIKGKKNDYCLRYCKGKHKKNIIQIGHKFLIIHTDY